MAEDAGTIYAEVRVQLADLKKDVVSVKTQMDKISKASDDTSKKSQSSFSKFFKFIGKSGVGAFLSFGAAIAIVTKALKASLEQAEKDQEVYSKFNTVFEGIQTSANNMADTFADSFDLADSTAQELLGTTGDLLTGFGATETQALSLSERVNTLAGDLASFSNIEGGVTQASKALTAALLGEREQAKQLGIVIREVDIQQALLEKGQSKLKGQALLLAKSEITLELAYKQSTKAIGDYERTSDSAANASRRLEESQKGLAGAFGTLLLEPVAKAKTLFSNLADALTKNIEKYNEYREALKAEQAGHESAEQTVVLLEKVLSNRENIFAMMSPMNLALEKELGTIGKSDKVIQDAIDHYGKLAVIQADLAAAREAESVKEQNRLQKEEAALVERNTKISTRIKIQDDLEAQLFAIDQLEKQSIVNGEEYDEQKEKAAVTQAALNELFKEGFDIEGSGVQEFLEKYGEFITVTDDLKNKSREAFEEMLNEADFYVNTAGDLFSSFFGSISDMATNSETKQTASLQKQLDNQLISQEQYDRKVAAIQIKAAKRDKALRIFDATVNTASAIIKALADVPFPANIALSVAAGVTGAAQIAAIASEPLPSFKTGGIVSPKDGGQIVRVAENGSPEMLLNGGESGQGMIKQFADQITASMGGAGNTVIMNNMINADTDKNMRLAARELYRYLKDEEVRNG